MFPGVRRVRVILSTDCNEGRDTLISFIQGSVLVQLSGLKSNRSTVKMSPRLSCPPVFWFSPKRRTTRTKLDLTYDLVPEDLMSIKTKLP